MAVKQNNTEANGAPSPGGGGSGSSGGGKSGGAAGAPGSGSKSKVGANADDSITGSGEPNPGSSVPNKQKKSSINGGGVGGGGGGSNGSGSGLIANNSTDISHILQLIELVELKREQVIFIQDIFKIYHHLIAELARVQVPRQKPEDLKRFKQDISKVGAFFGKATKKRLYMFYLHVVCELITQADGDPPSCAIAVIFQLFSDDMVQEAVKSLLDHNIPDQNIRKTVRLLSEWLRMCNFCQNLNLWIKAILTGVRAQDKYKLFDEIALENIEQLFTSLILPVLRPKVAPIVFNMLSSIKDTPLIFHKILPMFPKVISCLKQQALRPDAEETKRCLQMLVDLTSGLMVRFHGYDELYEPIEAALKDFRPSFNYLSYVNGPNGNDENEILLNNTNAKVGLVNLGNTCYMNSVLQALAMTKEFSREILLAESKSPLLLKMQQQIALLLYSSRYELTPYRVLNATRPPGFSPGLQQDSSEFLGYLLETLHEQERAYDIQKFAAGAALKAVSYDKSSKQGDDEAKPEALDNAPAPPTSSAPETLPASILLSAQPAEGNPNYATICTITTTATDNQCNVAAAATSSGSITKNTSTPVANDSSANDSGANSPSTNSLQLNDSSNGLITAATSSTTTVALANPLSTIEKTFTGTQATTYKCLSCGFKSRIVDSFRDLQLSFPEVNDCASNYSVQDLIDYYCSPEKLYGDNQYFCEQCKKLSDGERSISVISAPKNLILTLKHFKYDQKFHMRAKLMHKVFHDEKVSVKLCSSETHEEIASVHYDLYAGVVHSGFSMDSGHYYTYASDAANKWFKFNDNIVTPSKSEELHNLAPPNTPYILFYQMGARSSETSIDTPQLVVASAKVVKVDVPAPLTLDELPHELRNYVQHDNYAFTEELRKRRFKDSVKPNSSGHNNGYGRYTDVDDDDDEDQPPPASGCGGNAMNININRFVY